jgi:hypothetical protein
MAVYGQGDKQNLSQFSSAFTVHLYSNALFISTILDGIIGADIPDN